MTQPPIDRSELLAFAIELAEQTAAVINPFFGKATLQVERKSDASPVTLADRAAETFMRERIAERFPEHAIFGEEFGAGGASAQSTPYRWILDPIDGTKSFICGVPLFTTLIAVEFEGVPIVGVIHQPTSGETAAGDGERAWLNGCLIERKTDSSPRLQDATLLTTDACEGRLRQMDAQWDALVQAVRLYRTWGDGYGYLKLVAGQADIMCDPILECWDRAALLPVLRGAGCEFCGWDGSDAYQSPSLIATRAGLLSPVLNTLYPSGAPHTINMNLTHGAH
jgi:histidinol phosphatase-like enzyme (inositol monophosphatase family)